MSLLHGVHEVRLLRPAIAAGYFDSWDAALIAVENEPEYRAAYFTLNPITVPVGISPNPATLRSSRNTAGDLDITRRVWLLIDLDPVRSAGTNSTDEEKQSAREQAEAARQFLSGRGWPSPLLADSGNGWHLLYRIDLPNDAVSTDLVRGILARLKQLFPSCSRTWQLLRSNQMEVCKISRFLNTLLC